MNACREQYGTPCLLAQALFNQPCCLLCVCQCISNTNISTKDFTVLRSVVGLRRQCYEPLDWRSCPLTPCRSVANSLLKCRNYKSETNLKHDFVLCGKFGEVLVLIQQHFLLCQLLHTVSSRVFLLHVSAVTPSHLQGVTIQCFTQQQSITNGTSYTHCYIGTITSAFQGTVQ
jgi:hypothetical protein